MEAESTDIFKWTHHHFLSSISEYSFWQRPVRSVADLSSKDSKNNKKLCNKTKTIENPKHNWEKQEESPKQKWAEKDETNLESKWMLKDTAT